MKVSLDTSVKSSKTSIMAVSQPLPPFTADGLLPPGDYALSLSELRESLLVRGEAGLGAGQTWDGQWRARLVENLSILVRQLWQVGIREIFVNGSFVEDKDRPNDIDGYFCCDLSYLASGRLEPDLNNLDPHRGVDMGPRHAPPLSRLSETATADVARLPS